jgi:hypothetical protein
MLNTQDIAEFQEENARKAQDLVRERVARAICVASGGNPEMALYSEVREGVGDPIDFNDINGDPRYYHWRDYVKAADAAITAHTLALLDSQEFRNEIGQSIADAWDLPAYGDPISFINEKLEPAVLTGIERFHLKTVSGKQPLLLASQNGGK